MVDHTMRAFDVDLQELARKIDEMGRRDDAQVAAAIDALVRRDDDLARQVIAADDGIDALQSEIEEKAVGTIARRQPMAIDLREIVGALRIANELERVGDLAESIAKRVLLMTDEPIIEESLLQLQRMARLVREQLACVLKSYSRRDVAGAMEVWHKDQEVDALNNSLFRELLTHMMENPRNITACTYLIFCAKNIERIGDHATNIAENIYYIVEGRTVEEERPKAEGIAAERLPLFA